MGYHVSILRTNRTRAVPIQLAEAKALLVGAGWQFLPDERAFVAHDSDLEGETLWFQDGELWAKSPPENLLKRMIEVSKQLDARVRGDELETYEAIDKWYTHPDDAAEKSRIEAQSRALRRRRTRVQWSIRIGLVVVPFLIGLAYRWITQ